MLISSGRPLGVQPPPASLRQARLMLQRKLQERDTQAEENATLVKHLKQQVCELQQALEEGFEAHSKQDGACEGAVEGWFWSSIQALRW